MATNFVSDATTIEYANTGSAISSNDVVAMNDVVGIAVVDIAATNGIGTVIIEGSFSVPKISGVAWAVGDKVDWDASASAFSKGITTAAGDVTNCGVVTAAAASAATTGVVKLTPGTGTGI